MESTILIFGKDSTSAGLVSRGPRTQKRGFASMTARENVHTGTSQLSVSTSSLLVLMVCAVGLPACSDRVFFHWDLTEGAGDPERYN